jgi:hypothetical protein
LAPVSEATELHPAAVSARKPPTRITEAILLIGAHFAWLKDRMGDSG